MIVGVVDHAWVVQSSHDHREGGGYSPSRAASAASSRAFAPSSHSWH